MRTKLQLPSFFQFRALASATRTFRIVWPPVLSTVLPPAPQFLLLWIATVEDYLVLKSQLPSSYRLGVIQVAVTRWFSISATCFGLGYRFNHPVPRPPVALGDPGPPAICQGLYQMIDLIVP